jgi:hypothetical protein
VVSGVRDCPQNCPGSGDPTRMLSDDTAWGRAPPPPARMAATLCRSRLGIRLDCVKCDRGEPPDRPG